MVTCADPNWYAQYKPGWGTEWPHPRTALAIEEMRDDSDVRLSYRDGNVNYTLRPGRVFYVDVFTSVPGETEFPQELATIIS